MGSSRPAEQATGDAAESIERPRVEEILGARWAHLLTCVVAGPGFGKTTALSQATAANRRAPRGRDVVARASAYLGDDGGVRTQWSRELTGRGDRWDEMSTAQCVRAIADLVWSMVPDEICLIVDDAHLVAGPVAEELFGGLVDILPNNAHLVLCGRDVPQVARRAARRRGVGQLEVGEADLAFTTTEIVRLGELRGTDPSHADETQGWPALADLALRFGADSHDAVGRFLREEAIDMLTPDVVELLALVLAVGPIDDADAGVILGRAVHLDVQLGGLPMVVSTDGAFEAHSLWSNLVLAAVAPEEVAAWKRSAVAIARERGDLDRAFALATSMADWDLAVDVLADGCHENMLRQAVLPLSSWVTALPEEHRRSGPALLARSLHAELTSWSAARSQLELCIAELRSRGDVRLELVAMGRLGVASWEAGELGLVVPILERSIELNAAGEPLAADFERIGRIVAEDAVGNIDAVWELLPSLHEDELIEPVRSVMIRFRAATELWWGNVSRCLALTDGSVPIAAQVSVELLVLHVWAQVVSGDVDAARERLANTPQTLEGLRTGDRVLDANAALLRALTDPVSRPDDMVEAARLAEAGGAFVVAHLWVLAAAAGLVNAGSEEEAATLLGRWISAEDLGNTRVLPAVLRVLSLHYVLVPDARERWDALHLGDGPGRLRSAARALVAARDGSDGWVDMARWVIEQPGAAGLLPLSWLVELAVRLADRGATIDVRPFEEVVAHVGVGAHGALGRLIDADDTTVAKAARRLVGSVPRVPDGRFVLRVLGPVDAEVDGVRFEHPDWRRERVRSLMALVALRGEVARSTATTALWPDLDPDAGANNLRVSLSYLRRILEPELPAAQAPYHVAADSTTIRFHGAASWTIDLVEFESGLARAEGFDEAGSLPDAVAAYREALDWYRGDYLEDARATAHVELERERLRSRFVTAAVRLGSLLVAQGEVAEAHRLATRALEADPWSDDAGALDVRCFVAAGDRASARRALQRAFEVTEALAVPPSDELRRLERQLASG